MTIRLCFPLLLAVWLVGCDKWPSASERQPSGVNDSHRYQLHATSDGRMFRLDTRTGQTSLVTDKGLTVLPDNRRIQLRIGETYTLETGKLAVYEGNQKLNSDTRRVADALVEKYSDGMPTMSAVEAELARRSPPPPPGFILDKK